MCCLRNIAMCDYQESVTTGQTDTQTDRQTPDKVIPMCRYGSQATQLILFAGDTINSLHKLLVNIRMKGTYVFCDGVWMVDALDPLTHQNSPLLVRHSLQNNEFLSYELIIWKINLTEIAYSIQGKFRSNFIFDLIVLWSEGEFRTGLIESYIKECVTKVESGRVQDLANQSQISVGWKFKAVYSVSCLHNITMIYPISTLSFLFICACFVLLKTFWSYILCFIVNTIRFLPLIWLDPHYIY